MVDMIANSLCAFINRAFPHLLGFVSGASGGAVIAAALGVIAALVFGYKGLQRAVNGAHTPHRRAPRQRAPRRLAWLSDEEEYNAEWMDYELWQEK